MQAEQQIGHSTSQSPDLDWSQVRETILMLNLAVAQIELSLRSGDDSVSALADSFTSMMGNVEVICAAASALPESQEQSTIVDNCNDVVNQMHHAIIAFQFYDKLTQRLSHLSRSMGALGKLVENPGQLYNPYAWRGLQEKIKSTYTVESDVAMFEAIVNGKTVAEALLHSAQADTAATHDDDDVELF